MQNIMRAQVFLVIVFCLSAFGCASAPKLAALAPEPITSSQEALAPYLITLLRANHQDFHQIERARGVLPGDGSARIFFDPPLPNYWLGLELYIKDGLFQARPFGQPPAPQKPRFEVTRQELILQDLPFAPGRVLSGCVSVNFSQHDEAGGSAPYFFTGCFSAPLYPEGQSALAFAAELDYALALYELGQPMRQADFSAGQADAFRAATLGSKVSGSTQVREATWNISPGAPANGGGKERLSVWYSRQGDQWFPLASRFWTSGDPACPAYLDKAAE